MSDVELSAKADLGRIIAQLQALQKQADKATNDLANAGKQAGKTLNDTGKEVETKLGLLAQYARRAAEQIRGVFQNINLGEALKDLGKVALPMFKTAAAQALTLNDALHRIGRTLGLNAKEFSTFATTMTEGLGRIGVGADAGARALDGLAETQVRDQKAMLEYTKQAALLGQLAGEQGQEGAVTRGIAGVITARGGNVNDSRQVGEVVKALQASYNTTGQKPSAGVEDMKALFEGMSSDLRKVFTPQTATAMHAAEQAVGPQVKALFREFVANDKLGRLPAEMQGLRKAFTANGLDTKYLAKFAKGITGRIGFAPESSATTLGISPEAARGLVLIAQRLPEIEKAQARANAPQGQLEDEARSNISLEQAADANVNRAMSKGAKYLQPVLDTAGDVLKQTSKSDIGAIATTAVGTVAAAGLPALLSKMGGALGKMGGTAAGVATGKALEKTLGIQPVYVTNWAEIGDASKKGIAEQIGGAVTKTLGGGAGGAAAAGGAGALVGASLIGGLLASAALVQTKVSEMEEGKTPKGVGFRERAEGGGKDWISLLIEAIRDNTNATKKNTDGTRTTKQPGDGNSRGGSLVVTGGSKY